MSSDSQNGRCYQVKDEHPAEVASPQATTSDNILGHRSWMSERQNSLIADVDSHQFRQQQQPPLVGGYTQHHWMATPQQQQQQPYVQDQAQQQQVVLQLGAGRGSYTSKRPQMNLTYQQQLQQNQAQQVQLLQQVQKPSAEIQQSKQSPQHQQQQLSQMQQRQQQSIQLPSYRMQHWKQPHQLISHFTQPSGQVVQQQQQWRSGFQIVQRQYVLQGTGGLGNTLTQPCRTNPGAEPHLNLTLGATNSDEPDSIASDMVVSGEIKCLHNRKGSDRFNDETESKSSLSETGQLVRSSREVLQSEAWEIMSEQSHTSDTQEANSVSPLTSESEQETLAHGQSCIHPQQSDDQLSALPQRSANKVLNSSVTTSSYRQNSDSAGQVLSSLKSSTNSLVERLWGQRHNQSDDMTFQKALIKNLVEKLKGKREQLDSFVNAIETKGVDQRECVTLNQYSSFTLQKYGYLHVEYFKIWRWSGNDLVKDDLLSVDHCTCPFESRHRTMCINPYHYENVTPDNDLSWLAFQNVNAREGVVVPTGKDCTSKIIHFLMRYRQKNDEKFFAKKAIEYLVKRLKKEREGLESLLTLIKTAGACSNDCVVIERPNWKRLTFCKRTGFPHNIYSRIWRWPDLKLLGSELKHVQNCLYKFDGDHEKLCVNPYHCERIRKSD